jgi:hypothetical protein
MTADVEARSRHGEKLHLGPDLLLTDFRFAVVKRKRPVRRRRLLALLLKSGRRTTFWPR